jgi:diguanylate cyclase (GGDEF)-like protein/PAS domain S-box-containing protein
MLLPSTDAEQAPRRAVPARPQARPLPAGAWRLYVAAVAALTGAYVTAHFTGPHWLNSGPVYNAIGGSAALALVLGARRNARERRLPWYLFALGQALFVIGDVLAYNYERFFGGALPFPSIADPFYLAFYPLLVAGLLLLIHSAGAKRDRASLIDALIITVGLGTVSWVYLMAPYAHDHTLSLLTKLTSIAYPTMDILVLGVVLRVAVDSRRREPAFAMLVCGTAVLLVSDTIYGWMLLHGGYNTGGVLDAGWALFYALLGASALHPSMSRLTEPGPEPVRRLTRGRLALLACASLIAPFVILVREALHEPLDVYVLVSASVVLFVLVIVRMAGIVRRHEEATRREAALRVAGEALVSAATRQEIQRAALQAVRSVIEQGVEGCRLYLLEGSEGIMRAVGEGDDHGVRPVLRVEQLPPTLLAPGEGARVASVRRGEHVVCHSPLFVREELTGVLEVRCAEELGREEQESLATLTSEVALALHGAALAEETLSQRSEARLSSLIKNSSDVVCILDQAGEVHYVSPSVEQMFGYGVEEMAGRALAELVHPDELKRVEGFMAAIAGQPQGQATICEFRLRHAGGEWRHVEALATNLLGDESICGVVMNVRDISERKSFLAELEHQAFHDTLTGLPNRALFHNRVEHALAGRRRDQLPVAVLFLDVDDFKNINDSLGHAAGDELLQEIARRLEDCMRPVDTAARLGGDEFAVLIHEAESELQSVEIAQRVMAAIAAPLTLGGREVAPAASVGIAFSDQGMISAEDAEELLRNADAAMYMAKEAGKAAYRIYQPEMHAKALTRLELKADLQQALDAGQFTLRYQPIVDLTRGDMAGMEALVRWEHPTRGLVPPLEFVPLLEETGLIVPVGRHILEEACRWAARMQRECPRTPALSISVNVSAHQLQRPEFVGEVREALQASGIVPSSLVLELTESVMIQDVELTLLRLEELRKLGVRLAIDDFGTGYSSLNYVRQFDMDILKIDRSFLADTSPEVAELTAAIVQLARIFNLKAVAEGIENDGQLQQLQVINCDFGQGYHFAKPLLDSEILAMAKAQHGQGARSSVDAPGGGATRAGALAAGRPQVVPRQA